MLERGFESRSSFASSPASCTGVTDSALCLPDSVHELGVPVSSLWARARIGFARDRIRASLVPELASLVPELASLVPESASFVLAWAFLVPAPISLVAESASFVVASGSLVPASASLARTPASLARASAWLARGPPSLARRPPSLARRVLTDRAPCRHFGPGPWVTGPDLDKPQAAVARRARRAKSSITGSSAERNSPEDGKLISRSLEPTVRWSRIVLGRHERDGPPALDRTDAALQ